MKKIMLVDEYKVVNYAGGIEKVMCNFANEFINRGYEVSFVCLDTEKGYPFYQLKEEVKFINLAFVGEPYICLKYYLKKVQKELLRGVAGIDMKIGNIHISDPKLKYLHEQFIMRLRTVIDKIKPDIIICATSDSSHFAQLACKYKIPTINMCHTDPKRMINGALPYQKEAWTRANAVQVLMPSYVEILKQAGVENVVCIPNVVEQIDKSEKINLYKEKERYNIITVGRVERDSKRTHLLVEAFVKIADKFPNWNVEIYGDLKQGSYIKMIKKIITDKQL